MRRVLKAKAEHHAADSGVMADRAAIAAQAADADLAVAAGAVKAAVVDVTGFRMKIIASPQDSRANHAGNFFLPWLGWTAGPVKLAALCFEEKRWQQHFKNGKKK